MDQKISQSQRQQERIEGLDEAQDISLGEYPIDTVLIRSETRTVHDILRRISQGSFIMNPDFQRDFIWPDEKQSKFIESVIMRIPLPVLYLAENEEGKMIVVDGLQRLTTFKRFVNNEFSLKIPTKPGEKESELNKRTFKTLPLKLQNRIEDCNLILYIIDSKVPERARLDIFERVNGGIPLTRQQMRNCLFMGKATAFLRKEAATDIFLKAAGGPDSLSPKTMRDREFINRFCSFSIIPLDSYKGDMDSFLAEGLKLMNNMEEAELEKLSQQFRQSMKNNIILFEKHAFRKHKPCDVARNVINASLWDVMSVGFSRFSEYQIEEKKEQIRTKFYTLLDDKDFNDSITYGTSDLRRVQCRFNKFHQLISEVFHA